MSDLAQMRAERDRLDAEIRAAEQADRASWNDALYDCESAFEAWLGGQHILDVTNRMRKNVRTWDVGNGALVVTFASAEENYGRALHADAGGTLRLAWSAVPEPARFLAVIAALLGRS